MTLTWSFPRSFLVGVLADDDELVAAGAAHQVVAADGIAPAHRVAAPGIHSSG